VDAIMCFVRSQIDLLVVEDFVLDRAGIPPLWDLQAQQRFEKPGDGEAVGHLVYTLL
jgi:carbamoyltransferase